MSGLTFRKSLAIDQAFSSRVRIWKYEASAKWTVERKNTQSTTECHNFFRLTDTVCLSYTNNKPTQAFARFKTASCPVNKRSSISGICITSLAEKEFHSPLQRHTAMQHVSSKVQLVSITNPFFPCLQFLDMTNVQAWTGLVEIGAIEPFWSENALSAWKDRTLVPKKQKNDPTILSDMHEIVHVLHVYKYFQGILVCI